MNVNRIVILLDHGFRRTITQSEVQRLERQVSPAAASEQTTAPSPKGELGSSGFQIEVTALAWAVTIAEHRGRLYDSESSLVR